MSPNAPADEPIAPDPSEGVELDPEERAAFEDLPETEITVEAHVHYGMTGSFPLRMAELFFADDGLHVAEYGYVTPLFGLGMRTHKRDATAMRRVYEVHGIDEVLLQADSVVWLNYDAADVAADLRGPADRHGFEVDLRPGVGFDARESVRRFFRR